MWFYWEAVDRGQKSKLLCCICLLQSTAINPHVGANIRRLIMNDNIVKQSCNNIKTSSKGKYKLLTNVIFM